jgi:hypothetical protein
MGVERERIETFERLDNGLREASDWYLWGPYLSERQWGTVREDYSNNGDAWNYLPADLPDHAADGGLLVDDEFLVLVNAWWAPPEFVVPPTRPGQTWTAEIGSFEPAATTERGKIGAGERVPTGPRSMVGLRGRVSGTEHPRAAG